MEAFWDVKIGRDPLFGGVGEREGGMDAEGQDLEGRPDGGELDQRRGRSNAGVARAKDRMCRCNVRHD